MTKDSIKKWNLKALNLHESNMLFTNTSRQSVGDHTIPSIASFNGNTAAKSSRHVLNIRMLTAALKNLQVYQLFNMVT